MKQKQGSLQTGFQVVSTRLDLHVLVFTGRMGAVVSLSLVTPQFPLALF